MSRPPLEYYSSVHWRKRRRARLDQAGRRCEHEKWAGFDLKRASYTRCTATDRLQVHHKHYDSVGEEADEDLQVLCELHHIVAHLMNKKCLRDGDPVFDSDDDAEAHAIGYQNEDGSFDPGVLETVMADAPLLCPYCAHMAGKDD